MRAPCGSVACALAMAVLTRATTSWAFSPFSMITMPATVSPLPSRVTAPWRGSAPITTSATSRR
jgi:hypothetical protein